MAFRFAPAREAVYNNTAAVGAGFKLNFYIAGTTTPLDTYSDVGRTAANTNPVIADSAGRFGDIFLQPREYRVVLTDASDVEIYTADPVMAQARNNFNATTAPTASDDIDQGYDEGSLWVDRTNDVPYVCVDSANGAAVWTVLGPTTVSGTTDEITVAGGAVGIADNPIIPGTARILFPKGTTAQRPGTPIAGDFRLNTDLKAFEGYTTSGWTELVRHNLAASVAPAATNDTDEDYRPGSLWIDTTADKSYVCVDNTANTAIWKRFDNGVIQSVTGTFATYSSTTTSIPDDDTIPQNTEGAEAVTVAITPTNTANLLRIRLQATLSASGGQDATLALFQDTTADALSAAMGYIAAANVMTTISTVHEMAAGTTSETTFKMRYGTAGGTCYINGDTSTRKMGGVMAATIIVDEIVP